jgi:hypothetical protein
MCEQCSAKTDMYLEGNSVFGDYVLVRATQDGYEMKKDDWGLVQCNDPDFIFATTPWASPFYHLSDDDFDTLSPEQVKIHHNWEDDVEKFAEELLDHTKISGNKNWRFEAIVKLGMAAQKSGFVEGSDRIASWMFQYLGELLLKFPNPMPPDPAVIPTIPTENKEENGVSNT